MRKLITGIAAASLIATSAMADINSGPLAPGKPAGVKQADLADPVILVLAGIAVIAIIAVAASSGGGHSSSSGSASSSTGTG